ncbi:MAG: MFS transporter [Alphaproteobacteria bacterium]|nr:MFS transporter [Alphaproteobacteria bacterium]
MTPAPAADTPVVDPLPADAAIGLPAWSIVALCFVLAMLGYGVRDSFAVFLLPLQESFGWDRGAVSSVHSGLLVTLGCGAPLVGYIFDRFGPRNLYLLGLGAAVLGLLSAAWAGALWQFYLAISLGVGFGVTTLGLVSHSALLSRWYRGRLATAISVVHCSNGAGSFLLVPLAQWLIEHLGWRMAYWWLGGGVLALLPTLLLVPWRRIAAGRPEIRAEFRAQTAEGIGRGARFLRTVPFWGLTISFFLTSVGNYGLMLQLVPYLIDSGFQPLAAASAFGLSGLAQAIGMVGLGWLADRIGRARTAVISYVSSIAGIGALIFVGDSQSWLLVLLFATLFGSGLGSRAPMISAIAASIYGGQRLGAIMGSLSVGMGTGAATGAWLGGAIHDWTGGYLVLHLITALCLVGSMVPFLVIRDLWRN